MLFGIAGRFQLPHRLFYFYVIRLLGKYSLTNEKIPRQV